MQDFCVIGSCVTRDIWRVVDQEFNGRYFARTSFISMMSPPLEILESEIALNSAYERSSILADARRSALEYIAQNKPALIFIDFIDERYDIVEIDGSYLLRSDELYKSGLLAGSLCRARVIDRASDECKNLWKRSISEFSSFLREHSPRTKIFLHKAKWVLEHTDGVSRVPFSNLDAITKGNIMIEDYVSDAIMDLDNVILLEAPSRLQVASQSHLWGLSPFHYIDEYYYEIWRQMRASL